MAEIQEKVEPDALAKSVISEIQQLLDGKGSIDESAAKQIRKSWESVDESKLDDSTLYQSGSELLEKLRVGIHKQVERRDKSYSRLVEDIEKLEKAVADGNLTTALPLDQSTSERLKQLDGLSDQRRETAVERLNALGPEIKKLKQWRHWGTTQARETIITEVEALIDSRQSPTKIAREVQQARATWKSWDKTGDTSPKSLWSKFDDVCTRAYEPCQKHFDRLAQERKQNLAKRIEICEQLENIESDSDWKNPVWRDLDKQVRDLVTGWRRAGPVDRGRRKKVESRYDDVFKKLDARFERERVRNVKQRNALTEEVLTLKQSDDVHAAIARVKDIQRQWRPSVLSDRRQERKMWQQFKAACDDVFAVRDSERKTQSVEHDKSREFRRSLLQKLQSDIESDDSTALALSKRIDKLKQHWAQAGQVSPKHRAGLDKQFRSLLKKLDARAKLFKTTQDQELDTFIASLDALLEPYEQALLSDDAGSSQPQTSIDQCWPATDRIPQPMRTTLQKRFEIVQSAAAGDAASLKQLTKSATENCSFREDICLKMEVAVDIDSPAEFSKARMQWQVDRLKKAMTGAGEEEKAAGGATDSPQKLLREYWAHGPVEPQRSRSLSSRFELIRQKLAPQLSINLDFDGYFQPQPDVEPDVLSMTPKSDEADEPANAAASSDDTQTNEAETPVEAKGESDAAPAGDVSNAVKADTDTDGDDSSDQTKTADSSATADAVSADSDSHAIDTDTAEDVSDTDATTAAASTEEAETTSETDSEATAAASAEDKVSSS